MKYVTEDLFYVKHEIIIEKKSKVIFFDVVSPPCVWLSIERKIFNRLNAKDRQNI